jgi:hypothetical protein
VLVTRFTDVWAFPGLPLLTGHGRRYPLGPRARKEGRTDGKRQGDDVIRLDAEQSKGAGLPRFGFAIGIPARARHRLVAGAPGSSPRLRMGLAAAARARSGECSGKRLPLMR